MRGGDVEGGLADLRIVVQLSDSVLTPADSNQRNDLQTMLPIIADAHFWLGHVTPCCLLKMCYCC
jgi:hypothetical protein